MMYLAWVGATDPCKVVLLAHYDTDTSTNSAPYYLDVEPGGSAFSGYDISSSAKFGAGSLDVVDGAATEMSVWLNDDFDPLAIPFRGSATIDWRMRRPGGLQSTGLGTSETSFLNMELRFSNGDLLYFNFGYYGSAFSAQDQGAGLRVFTENGPAASGIYRETGYGWTDSNWHAIRVTVEGGDTVHLHVDGDYKTSVSIGPLAISGVTLDSVAFNGGKTFPTTTDQLQIDELRVMINRALSDATDYTPATGAWIDATCDSEVTVPGWTLIGTLNTSDAAASDELGSTPMSVCMNRAGTICVVGCPRDDSGKGAAYVFTRSGDAWTQAQKLTATGGATGDAFGTSVAISGDGAVIAIGAPDDDNGLGTDAGSVYVYTGTPGTMTQVQRLESSSSISTDGVGTSLAISETGTTIAAGAPDDAGGEGTVYVFAGTPGSMTEQAALYDPLGLVNGNQGRSVALSSNGNILAVGASGFASGEGRVDMYSRSGSSWTLDQSLQRSDMAGGQLFGTYVSLNDAGTVLAVANDSGTTPRLAFFRDTGTWAESTSERTTFRAITANLDSTGDRLIATYTGPTSDSFEYNRVAGAAWTTSFAFDYSDNFGASAWFAKGGNHLAVCAPLNDTAASNAGAVYFFKYTS